MDIANDPANPTRVLWVDAKVATTGNGTAGSPFKTITEATKAATPGTAIMVRGGDYHENVFIPRTADGTTDHPIYLVSADGPQKAHIIAPNSNEAAIVGGGVQNFVVDGFWVSGGKNGIQFSQNDFSFTDMIGNIVIRNNKIDGFVEDGVKANGGEHVYVMNNVISGGTDEGIDFVAINHGVISHNEVNDHGGTSAAIFAKGGSNDIEISYNYIHGIKSDGISVGGWSNYYRLMRPGFTDHIASNVSVFGNVVEDVGKRPLSFFGAYKSTAYNNYLQANATASTAVYVGNSDDTQYGVFHSSDITVRDNYITHNNRQQVYVDVGSGGLTFVNNTAAVSVAGAGATLASHSAATISTPAPISVGLSPIAVGSSPVSASPVAAPPVDVSQFLPTTWWHDSGATTRSVRDGAGTSGNDLFDKATAVMTGGTGDDTYVVRDGTGVVEREGGGIDTLLVQGRYAALPDYVENLTLQNKLGGVAVGNIGDNAIKGSAAADILVGGGGHDKMTGGGGADTFIVGHSSIVTHITDFVAGDTILVDGNPFATFGELQKSLTQIGANTVLVLSDDRAIVLDNIKATSLTAGNFDYAAASTAVLGQAATNAVRVNDTTHIASGTAGSDLINGNGSGILIGGAGDDNYILKQPGDHIVEHASGGIDTALLYYNNYTMEANVEDVRIRINTGATVIGNNLANYIVGGDGNDVLAGGAGADTLVGGKGADVFAYSALNEGGDTITGFELGIDKLDVRALKADYADLAITTANTGSGLQVFADHGGQHVLLATLSNVITHVDTASLLMA